MKTSVFFFSEYVIYLLHEIRAILWPNAKGVYLTPEMIEPANIIIEKNNDNYSHEENKYENIMHLNSSKAMNLVSTFILIFNQLIGKNWIRYKGYQR